MVTAAALPRDQWLTTMTMPAALRERLIDGFIFLPDEAYAFLMVFFQKYHDIRGLYSA
jgi:hypothetical protein